MKDSAISNHNAKFPLKNSIFNPRNILSSISIGKISLYLSIIVILFIVTFPLFWMTMSSFKPRTEHYISPPNFFPKKFTFHNYIDLFESTNFARYFKNSLIVAIGTTTLSIVLASFGGYVLSRFKFPGINAFARLTLFTYMVPTTLIIIPMFILLVKMDLQNKLISLIITHTTFNLPFALWLLRSYFRSIPIDLEEAALIDGCTRFQALRRVVLPIALPGIISTSIFAFTNSWNEFLYATVFIQTDKLRTLPPGMGILIQSDNIYDWGVLMASAVLMAIPTLIFYAFIQRNLVVDLSAGAVK